MQKLMFYRKENSLANVRNFPTPLWRCGPTRTTASSFLKFLDHTQRHTTFGRTPLDAWSALRRDLYLATSHSHMRQMSMPPARIKPTIPANKHPHKHALDRVATGNGVSNFIIRIKYKNAKRIPSIFNDESTGSFICLRRHIYMSHVLLLCVSFLRVLVVFYLRVTYICVA
jgi:hypothetical protein